MPSENVSSADHQQERLLSNSENLNHYLAGFVDGEGCFSVTIHRSKYLRLGWNVNPLFQVYQHKDNSEILSVFRQVFDCGYVSEKGGNPLCHVYCVDSIKDLTESVIPFFNRYKLLGNKSKDFELFSNIVHRVRNKEHLTKDGLVSIAKLAFQMNSRGRFRKNSLETIVASLEESPETKRQTHK